MIADYRDHAANERTFLAWIRTGIAVVAFGFLIEKFNRFMLALTHAAAAEPQRPQLEQLVGRAGRYDGLALMFGGAALVVLATARFMRTTRLLDDEHRHAAKHARTEMLVSAWLVLMIVSYSLYLAFD